MSHEKKELLLGKHTHYVSEYDASLIFPIARDENREKLNQPVIKVNGSLPFFGFDVWTGYEVSWLNLKGKPQVAIAQFIIPAQSSHIVESKSFKLYLNSFNQTRLDHRQDVEKRLQQDLSAGFGAQVQVQLHGVMGFPINHQNLGVNIDYLDVEVNEYSPNAQILSLDEQQVSETVHSNLLKSNCPVTSQPDWATLVIQYKGVRLNHEALLKYIISYRGHDDFHEHCVEQIFCDLLNLGGFEELTVSARYTRRGGLDINPTRSLLPIDQETLIGRLDRQ
ncbi:NADPH-dependent 7-cyano-7-deazaguanine reductase QueF [Oceaniserpentilla sp. 4NH20-0058]|uniref:NADPH-dependent 7-cyano-7-deazaguanine reductase QueF n=1 Tax=Oceaniserpentilla sp. 4NH20-0058 TaxID=3127660 RepID=UPI003105A7E7